MQKLTGRFKVTFRGIVLLAVSKTELTDAFEIDKTYPTGTRPGKATVYAIHITPFFAFGFVWPR